MPNNFVYLPQAKTTINLLHISAVQWYKVENPEVDSSVYVTTVAVVGAGDFYITPSDTKYLMKALDASNQEPKTADAIRDSCVSNPKVAVPAGSGSRHSQYSENNN